MPLTVDCRRRVADAAVAAGAASLDIIAVDAGSRRAVDEAASSLLTPVIVDVLEVEGVHMTGDVSVLYI